MHCPTLDELTASTLATLPLGRAWQTNDGGPFPPQEPAFNPNAFEPDAFQTRKSASWLYAYWRSFAVVLHYLTQRLCALRLEFWCQTLSETRDQWMEEYGLPDACDPFPDLCTKVAAIGGQRCEYFSAITARMGWRIECFDGAFLCGSRAGAGNALAGKATPGSARATDLRITVFLRESPSFGGRIQTQPLAGRIRAGMRAACAPDISPLQCLINRIAPAHVRVTYATA